MNHPATARLKASAPVIFVRDIDAAAAHWRDAMGFSFGKIWGDPPSFTIARRDGMHVMLKQIDEPAKITPRHTVSAGLWDMYFWVDDVEALHVEFVDRGAAFAYGICDQPYGCREFGIRDLDGHEIGFGQETD
jgi:catechol 2,3-dioxygenase-like lactoylglutathione lyase family enzyme